MSVAPTQIEPVSPEVAFERFSPARRVLRRLVLNPLANYAPAGLMKAALRLGRSELAAANWKEPGGWRSMVISYEGRCRQIADRLLVSMGTIPMALRNRKRLAAHLLTGLLDSAGDGPVRLLYLGGGGGQTVFEALSRTRADVRATLVDYNAEAIEYARRGAASAGLAGRIRFVHADVRHLPGLDHAPPHVLTMLGICEYLPDDQVLAISGAVAPRMPAASAVVFNSLSPAHGTDRFFRRVFGLHMIHRTPRQVCELMARAGFGDFAVHPEPLGVYHVVVGRKKGPPGASG